jgi:hypothetical protein
MEKASRLAVIVSVTILFCGVLATQAVADSPSTRCVVTIYNFTGIHLDYELQILPSPTWDNPEPKWSEWKHKHHKHPNGGYMYHWFYGPIDGMKIRYDRIGGDGEYTEQRYNLPFNTVRKFGEITKRDGKPYYFKFDAGGQLLHFKRYKW